MRVSKPLLLPVFAVGLSVACADERVHVGGVEDVLDLAECSTERTMCELASFMDAPPKSIERPVSSQTCVPVEGADWHIAWRQPLIEVPCPELGTCTARAVSVGADGSVWIASFGDNRIAGSEDTLSGVFLMHLDRDGVLIAQRVIETRRLKGEFLPTSLVPGAQHALAIAADARGHVFVALAWNESPDAANRAATIASLSEYDASAKRVGESVALLGVSSSMQLALIAGPSLILLAVESGQSPGGAQGRSRMAAFGSGLKPLWVQSRALPGASANVMLANSEHVTLGRFDGSALEGMGALTLDSYDGNGNPLRRLLVLSPSLPFAMDADDSVFLLDFVTNPTSTVRKIDRKGATLSSVTVTRLDAIERSSDIVPITAVDSAGNSYLLREVSDDGPDAPMARLVEVDATARHCVTSSVRDTAERDPDWGSRLLSALFVTDSGEMYVRSQRLVMRLTR